MRRDNENVKQAEIRSDLTGREARKGEFVRWHTAIEDLGMLGLL